MPPSPVLDATPRLDTLDGHRLFSYRAKIGGFTYARTEYEENSKMDSSADGFLSMEYGKTEQGPLLSSHFSFNAFIFHFKCLNWTRTRIWTPSWTLSGGRGGVTTARPKFSSRRPGSRPHRTYGMSADFTISRSSSCVIDPTVCLEDR